MKPRNAVLVVFAVFVVAAIYRAVHFYVSGFFVPDEYAYLYYHLGDLVYEGRYFFNAVNLLWFGWLPSTDAKIALMSFYLAFWFGIGLVAAWQTVKELGYSERVQSLTLLIGAAVPVYLLFSDGVIVESVAFPTVMLGLWALVRFRRMKDARLAAIAALSFAAAAYTHLDFVVLLIFGWVFFIKKPVALAAFVIPALLFLNWPVDLMGAGALFAGHGTSQGVLGAVAGVTSTPNTVHPPGATDFGSHAATLLRGAYLFAVGSVGGFGPAALLLMGVGLVFAVARKNAYLLAVGILSALAFIGTAYLYSGATVVYTGTMIRYSFDLLPTFFVLAPLTISKLNGKKTFAVLTIGMLGWGAAGAVFAAPIMAENLASSYPFIGPPDNFLSLSYRTPYAAMRDYFSTQPKQDFVVLAEDPGSLDGNMTSMWSFTPGISSLNVTFLPYAYGAANPGHFYVYVPKDIPFQNMSGYLVGGEDFTVISVSSSFLFASVSFK